MDKTTQKQKPIMILLFLILATLSFVALEARAQVPAGGSLSSVLRLSQNMRRMAFVTRRSLAPIEAFYPANSSLSVASQNLLVQVRNSSSDEIAAALLFHMDTDDLLAFQQANQTRWVSDEDYQVLLAHRIFNMLQPTKDRLLKAFEHELAARASEAETNFPSESSKLAEEDVLDGENGSLLVYAREIFEAKSPNEVLDLICGVSRQDTERVYLLRILDEGVLGEFQVHMLKNLSAYEDIWTEVLPENQGSTLRDWLLMAKMTLTRAGVLDRRVFTVPKLSVLSPKPKIHNEPQLDGIDLRRIEALVAFARVKLAEEEALSTVIGPYRDAFQTNSQETNDRFVSQIITETSSAITVPPAIEAYNLHLELARALPRIEDLYFSGRSR